MSPSAIMYHIVNQMIANSMKQSKQNMSYLVNILRHYLKVKGRICTLPVTFTFVPPLGATLKFHYQLVQKFLRCSGTEIVFD